MERNCEYLYTNIYQEKQILLRFLRLWAMRDSSLTFKYSLRYITSKASFLKKIYYKEKGINFFSTGQEIYRARLTLLSEGRSEFSPVDRPLIFASGLPRQIETIRAKILRNNKIRCCWSPPARRTRVSRFSLSFLRSLFFFLHYFRLPSIYFAIYRHTYRIYLHKLCNTDEPTLTRRTTYILSHHPISVFIALTQQSHACVHLARLHEQVAFLFIFFF